MTSVAPRTPAPPAEHRWPPLVAVAAAVVLWALLPAFFFEPLRWVAVAVCALLAIPLIVINPHRLTRETRWSRSLSVGLSVFLLAFNQVLLVRLVYELLTAPDAEGAAVLVVALQLWVTNSIAFGLLYSELDRGGPVARSTVVTGPGEADFLFPQDTLPSYPDWRPRFFDYLYVSLTAGMAFSAADAQPLRRRTKAFMAIEALSGYIITALVIARAVSVVT